MNNARWIVSVVTNRNSINIDFAALNEEWYKKATNLDMLRGWATINDDPNGWVKEKAVLGIMSHRRKGRGWMMWKLKSKIIERRAAA